MVKMFLDDDFAVYVYEKHIEAIIKRFKKEKRFPCYSVGKLVYGCNRRNFYIIKDMFDGVQENWDRESIIRMVMGTVLHDAFVMSDKAEWHIEYKNIFGHIDEYFPEARILVEKKTTLEEIPGWKQTKAKTGQKFLYLPTEEWENQLRYYYLLLQKGIDVKTKKPTNPDGVDMVKRVYVVYYQPSLESLMQPYIVPVPMVGPKWEIPFIEHELLSKKREIEECLKKGTVPPRTINPNKCAVCPYMYRCFYEDGGSELPESLKYQLGARVPEVVAQEFEG